MATNRGYELSSSQTNESGYPVPVTFAGATLLGIMEGERAWVAMRPVVEGMGLSWAAQYRKILDDEVLSSVVAQKATTAVDGKTYMTLCLPEDYLQGWLFTVNPKKVRADIREAIVRYKRECYRVLHEAFTRERAERVTAIDVKRATAHVLTDMLQEVMQEDGKEPHSYHFINEHRLCNKALCGEFKAIEESSLSSGEAWRLARIRRKDAVLIARGLTYEQRKDALLTFALALEQASVLSRAPAEAYLTPPRHLRAVS